MNGYSKAKQKREFAKQLPVRESTHNRLRTYIEERSIRPVITDVVSIAVDCWLDEQELPIREQLTRHAKEWLKSNEWTQEERAILEKLAREEREGEESSS